MTGHGNKKGQRKTKVQTGSNRRRGIPSYDGRTREERERGTEGERREGERETETETETETQRHRDTETQRHRDTETQRHRDTETQRHRDTETQRHRDRETERHRDRETERQRDRDRETETETETETEGGGKTTGRRSRPGHSPLVLERTTTAAVCPGLAKNDWLHWPHGQEETNPCSTGHKDTLQAHLGWHHARHTPKMRPVLICGVPPAYQGTNTKETGKQQELGGRPPHLSWRPSHPSPSQVGWFHAKQDPQKKNCKK